MRDENKGAIGYPADGACVIDRGTYFTYPGMMLHEYALREVQFVDWQPGNGTSYKLLVVNLAGFKIPGRESEPDVIYVEWTERRLPNSGIGMTLLKRNIHSDYPPDYIMEKLDCSAVDARAILDALRQLV